MTQLVPSFGVGSRNDTAPLPALLNCGGDTATFPLHISDKPDQEKGELVLRCVWFRAAVGDEFEVRMNGSLLSVAVRDPDWKDAQIASPAPQPVSGGKGQYKMDPEQRLLRLDCAVPRDGWKQGVNRVEVRLLRRGLPSQRPVQLEKLEAHLRSL